MQGARRGPAGAVAGLGALLAVAFTGLAFHSRGGLQLGPLTFDEAAMLLAGALLVAAAVLRSQPRRQWASTCAALFAALTALTALSISWSIQPSDSWLEANRTVAYLGVFAGAAALARLAPSAGQALLAAILAAAVVVCGYGILTKVFVGLLNADHTPARLREPLGYWNALGLIAALGVIPGLWLATRRIGPAALRALAYPALGLLGLAIMLSFSRGALVALGIGLVLWLAAAPRRLHSVVVLGVASAGAASATLWAFDQSALIINGANFAQRTHAGHNLGAVTLAMLLALAVAGYAIERGAAHRPPSAELRRRCGRLLLIALALSPLALAGALAASERGLGGSVSHAWHSFAGSDARSPRNDPSRLTSTASVRGRYWREAGRMWADHRIAGLGAGGYDTARPRYRRDILEVRHAHGYFFQTLADLGLLGTGLSLALLAAWLAAAMRATGLASRRDIRRPFTPERTVLVALSAVALVFGVHSLIDVTWFVPATAAIGLACAGFVAGRGPSAEPSAPAPKRSRGRIGIALAVVALALACVWSIRQPQRAAAADDRALAALDRNAFADARSAAHDAHEANPLSVDPLFTLSVVEQAARRPAAALSALERAVRLQPANAETWSTLSDFEDTVLNRPVPALAHLAAARELDPWSPRLRARYDDLRARAQTGANAPAAASTATAGEGNSL